MMFRPSKTDSDPLPTVAQRWCLTQGNGLRGLLIACAFLMLLAADSLSRKVRQERQQQIANMSAAERSRLERNFKSFQQLGKDQRTKIRQLRQAVQTDPELHTVFDAYFQWLETLTPWQREELRKETDPAARMDLVRTFWAEQPKNDALFPLSSRFGRANYRLTSEDLKAMMSVIEDQLHVSPEERRRLNSLSGVERYMSTLEHLMLPMSDSERLRRFPWPNQSMTEQMINAISNEKMRQVLHARLNPEQQRRAVAAVLVQGLFTEWKTEIEKKQPNEETIKAFFLSLDGPEQDEIMRLPPIESKQRLREQYNQKYHTDVAKLTERMRKLRTRLGSVWRPPGSLGPFNDVPPRKPFDFGRFPTGAGKNRSNSDPAPLRRPFERLRPELKRKPDLRNNGAPP